MILFNGGKVQFYLLKAASLELIHELVQPFARAEDNELQSVANFSVTFILALLASRAWSLHLCQTAAFVASDLMRCTAACIACAADASVSWAASLAGPAATTAD